MLILHPLFAGLDVHKDTVVACLWLTGGQGVRRSEVRTFRTMKRGSLVLTDWLEEGMG